MLKLLNINNLASAGVNTDLAPWELPPEYITDGINFRVFGNRMISTGATEDWTTPPVHFNAGFLMHVGSISGSFWMVAGRSAVYVWNSTTWNDISITTGGLYGNIGVNGELDWTGCMLGKIPIINNPATQPEYWNPQSVGQELQPLDFKPGVSWASENKTFKVIRSHKNFLFALNLTENGVDFPNAYRWSHPADINGLPFTWDETDLSAIAGRAQLGGDGGQIIDGLSLRDAFCIYSESGVDVLEQSGDEFIWRARELSSTVGLLNKDCIVEVKGVHYFISDGDILRNDGTTIRSIVHKKIRKRINSQINPDFFHRAYAVRNNSVKEIWFCFPEGVSEYPNVAYVYNWLDESWAIQQIPENTAFTGYGPQSDPPTTWDNIIGTWDNTSRTWGSARRTPLDDTLVSIRVADSGLFILDPGNSGQSGDIAARIERLNLALEGHKQITSISRVYPHMTGTQDVGFQVGSQDHAGAPVRWSPIHIFNPATDRKIDIRTTGELHAWRITSIGTGRWSISGLGIEYALSGER